METSGELAFDTETTGLDLHRGAKVFSYSTCDGEGRIQVVRGEQLTKERLSHLWETRVLVMHNARFDMLGCEYFLGESLTGARIHCTHKMSHLLQNHHHSHRLDHLAWELAGYKRVDDEISRIAAGCGGYHKVPEHIMTKYQKLDAERTMCLFLFFWPKIKANPKWLDCYNVEIGVIPTTIRMERRGLMVNRPGTLKMIESLQDQVDELREQVSHRAGYRLNPGSDDEVRDLFYRKYNFPVYERTGKTRSPSVDKGSLFRLREETHHPMIELILKFRSYTRGITTLNSYLKLATKDDILHPTINTCAAITGRQSSQDPNLQNVQKSGVLLNPYPVLARKAFRPRPGYVNLHVDYSGIELRLLVHYAQEPELVKLMNTPGGDPHSLAAQVFYGERFTKSTGDMRKTLRSSAKNANFATAYGSSPANLYKTLGISQAEGIAAYKRYKERWPLLATLTYRVAHWVKETREGFVETTFGRRLHVPKNKAYVGVNYLIQGTAAEILKRAEIGIDQWHMKSWNDEVKMLLPIHDELVIEYPRTLLKGVKEYTTRASEIMTAFPQISVPLEVEFKVVTVNWERKASLE